MAKKKIVIFGSGVHAKVIFHSIINDKNYKFLGFIDFKNKEKLIIQYKKKKYKVISDFKKLDILKKIKKLHGVIGIGSNFNRYDVYKLIIKLNLKIKWETIVFKGVNFSNNVKIGNGSVIMGNVLLNNNTSIGSHCIINSGSIIEHDNSFDNFSSTGPGVTTGGNVKVGQFSHLGIGSTILNGKKISSNTIIGGGSLVNKNCNSFSIYFGIPAKKKSKRSYNKKYL